MYDLEKYWAQVQNLSQALINSDCFGCINNCPSQRDHPCLEITHGENYNYTVTALNYLHAENEFDQDIYSQLFLRIRVPTAAERDEFLVLG